MRTNNFSPPHSCNLRTLYPKEIQTVLDELVANQSFSLISDTCKYLLIHGLDGVFWGQKIPEQSTFRLSIEAFPEFYHLNPNASYSRETLIASMDTFRCFGPDAELMLWRSEGNWQGRILSDIDSSADEADKALRPKNRMLILIGSAPIKGYLQPKDGFAAIEEKTNGMAQVIPWNESWDLKSLGSSDPSRNQSPIRVVLQQKEYFYQDPDSGAVIPSLSRSCDLQLKTIKTQ